MFQKVLASFGSGGAKVDAQLRDRNVRPGGVLRGEVFLIGGQVDQEVESLGVTLLARIDTSDDRGRVSTEDIPFQNVHLAGRELVRAGSQIKVPFEVQLPWETPITTVLGKHLTGMAIGLQTNLDLASTMVDPMDVDAVSIEPLGPQHRILDALSHMGFQFRGANLNKQRLDGVEQQLPFFQEIGFTPSREFAGAFTELKVTFLARQHDMKVVLDAHKKVRVTKGGGLGNRTQSFLGAFPVEFPKLQQTNWEQQIGRWLHDVAKPRGIFD
ncbi:sporulation-control protein [Herbihabitans rhizosphaerae]|uniref:Sporulation-control protein n=1 Tax=Herbihabitans rhizosphaerae TaxID=1872711 RepID=A0A4Q7KHT4_9PSEU|nr:sporulation protein [Herbihabitans rhizosphaerae]RZS34480.1 sporulation-control protein [Herbihabitans rhizosphaerae]